MENDWPSMKETDRQILDLLFNGKSPFGQWEPSRNVEQAVKVAQDIAWKRGWNFDLKWVSYTGNIVIDEWEARLANLNTEAAERKDYRKAVEDCYWATAKTPLWPSAEFS